MHLNLAEEDEAVVKRDCAVHGRDVAGGHVDVAHDRAAWRGEVVSARQHEAALLIEARFFHLLWFVSSPIGRVLPSTSCKQPAHQLTPLLSHQPSLFS